MRKYYRVCGVSNQGIAYSSWVIHEDVRVTYALDVPTVPRILGSMLFASKNQLHAEMFASDALHNYPFAILFEVEIETIEHNVPWGGVETYIAPDEVLEAWLWHKVEGQDPTIATNRITPKKALKGFRRAMLMKKVVIPLEELPGHWRG